MEQNELEAEILNCLSRREDIEGIEFTEMSMVIKVKGGGEYHIVISREKVPRGGFKRKFENSWLIHPLDRGRNF